MASLSSQPAASPPPRSSTAESPSSDTHFWSALRDRVDGILQKPHRLGLEKPNLDPINAQSNKARRMKDDSLLLLKGFDCVSHSLSNLSRNLEAALQGAKRLAEEPTVSEILHSKVAAAAEENLEADKIRLKRRRAEDETTGLKPDCVKPEGQDDEAKSQLKKAKKTAVIVAKMAASLATELKALRSEFESVETRCVFLEEENRSLREEGVSNSSMIRPEEDDMMRLQMEALLAEKSRLASENANLVRENQCLHQLVEYHQLNSRSISDSYEEVLRGICLDFSSPPLTPDREREEEDDS